MPEPFAKPSTFTPPTRDEATLGNVSVVMMACKNSAMSHGAEINPGSAPQIFSPDSGLPMTPVDDTNISDGAHPSRSASCAAHVRATARPSAPLQALAFPE